MAILVCMGPVIGLLVLFVYKLAISAVCVFRKCKAGPKCRKGYYLLFYGELLLLLVSIAVPAFSEGDFLLEGFAVDLRFEKTDDKCHVSFQAAKRKFGGTYLIAEEDMDRVRVESTAAEGKVYLRLWQGEKTRTIDITNYSGGIDMSGFRPGNVGFAMTNDKGRDVKFRLYW